MQTLELNTSNIFGSYSSGEQYKGWVDFKGVKYLVKVNTHHRESLKEVSAYKLAKAFGLNCVEYRDISIKFKGLDRNACICKSYLRENENDISIWKALGNRFDIKKGESASSLFSRVVSDVSYRLRLDKDNLSRYIKTILTFDYIICNTDRHLNNISFIENNGVYRFAPIYDNGKSFLSTDAILTDSDLIARSNKYKSKPFSSNPKSNLIDIEFSKYLVRQWLSNAGNLDNVLTNKGHLKIVKYRINKLLSL